MRYETKVRLIDGWKRHVVQNGNGKRLVQDPHMAMMLCVICVLVGIAMIFGGGSIEEMITKMPVIGHGLSKITWLMWALTAARWIIAAISLWIAWQFNCRALVECFPDTFDKGEHR